MAGRRTARAPAQNRGDDEQVSLVAKKDFKKAMRVYHGDIKPAMSKAAEFNQELSTAYKMLKKECHIQSSAAKVAFKLDTMEESRRDDWLRAFSGLLEELRIYMPSDLVDAAEGKEPRSNVVPLSKEPVKPSDAGLVTLGPDDLLDDDDDGDDLGDDDDEGDEQEDGGGGGEDGAAVGDKPVNLSDPDAALFDEPEDF